MGPGPLQQERWGAPPSDGVGAPPPPAKPGPCPTSARDTPPQHLSTHSTAQRAPTPEAPECQRLRQEKAILCSRHVGSSLQRALGANPPPKHQALPFHLPSCRSERRSVGASTRPSLRQQPPGARGWGFIISHLQPGLRPLQTALSPSVSRLLSVCRRRCPLFDPSNFWFLTLLQHRELVLCPVTLKSLRPDPSAPLIFRPGPRWPGW